LKEEKELKYVLVIGDGMADYPVPGRNYTPLELARTPHLDFLAARGEMGKVRTIPSHFPKGSDVAILSVLGYSPSRYYTGRGFIEALNQGIEISPSETAFRCNLVTVEQGIMKDYSAGHISTQEAKKIISFLNKSISGEGIKFSAGVSFRNILVVSGKYKKITCTPPHDFLNQPLKNFLPHGRGSHLLRKLIEESKKVLENHPVNVLRRKKNLPSANMIWPWAPGVKKTPPSFEKKYQLRGAVIAGVDLINGLGRWLGLKVIKVKGATGYLDTNYRGKVEAALKALKKLDFVFVHIEAPDETGHSGQLKLKLQAIEDFDRKVIGPLLEGLEEFPAYKIMVLPDHYTPLSLRTHTDEPVPWVIYSSFSPLKKKGKKLIFSERALPENSLYFQRGTQLMRYFLNTEPLAPTR
jgi:2,3-bisphosphoglycerate-independent phosphoglycerate mutase